MLSKAEDRIKDALKLMTALLVLSAVVFLTPIAAFADDENTFSVTLPSSLPIDITSDGEVITASSLTIKNNKTGPIAVSSIKIKPAGDWQLTDFGTDYTKEPTDLHKYGLKLAGMAVPADGNADLSGIPFIDGMGQFTLSYDANTAVQTTVLAEETIGQMLITIGWQEGQIYSLTVTRPPDKQTYYAGEAFDPTGMEVTATYYGGGTEVITSYDISNGESLSAGQSGVTISITNEYGAVKSTVCPVTVSRKLSAIKLVSGPYKNSYTAGESFDTSGMVIEAVYADGTSRTADGWTYSPAVISKGTDKVTVSYEEGGITKTLTFPVEVKKSTSIPESEITLSAYEYEYDGQEKKPLATVILDGVTLAVGEDYILSYENNVNPGTARAVITGTGKYTGTKAAEFTINKKTVLTVSWSGTSLTCNNSCLAPTATLEGLKDGDTAEITVTGGAYEPGNYTATAIVNITSGNAASYEIQNDSCTFTITAGQAPTLQSGCLRTTLIKAGLPLTDGKCGIAVTEIVTSHTPTSDVLYSANLDSGAAGDIKGYVYPLSGGKYKLIISGNGADTIYCNKNSSMAFLDLACNYDGGCGAIAGLEKLNTSNVTSAAYMFSNITLGDFKFPYMSFPSLTSLSYMFYGISANSLSFASGFSVPNAQYAGYAFQNASISGSFDINGLTTSNVKNMGYMFANSKFTYLDLNSMDTSSATSFEGMFEGASIGTLKINSWKTSSVGTTQHMFRDYSGSGAINISAWDVSSLIRCDYMFFNSTGITSVYSPYNFSSCRYFDYMFGGSSNTISAVYSQADFITSYAYDQAQKPCTDNANFPDITVSGLKLASNGGILTYSMPVGD